MKKKKIIFNQYDASFDFRFAWFMREEQFLPMIKFWNLNISLKLKITAKNIQKKNY